MQKITKIKEKVKPDKDRVGIIENCKYDYAIDLGDGKFVSPVTKKVYREVDVNTTSYLSDNEKKY